MQWAAIARMEWGREVDTEQSDITATSVYFSEYRASRQSSTP